MARSFIAYLHEYLYQELFDELEDYIAGHKSDLRNKYSRLHKLGTVEFSDMDIKTVHVDDGHEMDISMEIVVSASIIVKEGDYHYDEEDEIEEWYSISAKGNLSRRLSDFEICSISPYQKGGYQRLNPLDPDFVPQMVKHELDKIAENFLLKYYPEALLQPVWVDPDVLVSKMGLKKEVCSITADCSVFGRIYFHDTDAPFYDEENERSITRYVEAGTIFVDPQVFFLRNLGALNNTIVHECVHWEYHRKAFELERLFDSKLTQIECQVVGGIRGHKWSKSETIEWQANTLAPRIQMPAEMFRKKAEQVIRQYKNRAGTSSLIDIIEPVIDELAQFFCVSRAAAKIRMVNLGYEEAAGAFIWIDGHYVKAHTWKKGFLKNNQTFTVDEETILSLAICSYDLRDTEECKYFIYVDSHLVLRNSMYIKADENGFLALTDYALRHMDECCISFELSIKGGHYKSYHTECFLNRSQDAQVIFECKYSGGLEHAKKGRQIEVLGDLIDEEMTVYNSLPNNYVGCMDIVRKWRKMTYIEIAEETHVDEKTVRRVFHGESGSIERLATICLSMQLPPTISQHIIKKSPWSFNLIKKEHQTLLFALQHYYAHRYAVIEEFLQRRGVAL